MREAKQEERRRFYLEEWRKEDLPDFLLQTLSMREFGFDLDGTGPSHRYIQFLTVEDLANFLRLKAPYASYSSVCLYQNPKQREGWIKAELVFDIDAKDLPVKRCRCQKGEVCEKCILEAKQLAIEFSDVLKSDFGFREIHFVYSGRGFHMRVTDESAMILGSSERDQIVGYIVGGVIPSDLMISFGYSRVFRKRIADMLEKIPESELRNVIKSKRILGKILAEKSKIIERIRAGQIEEILRPGEIGTGTIQKLFQFLTKMNYQLTDGKVTVDTKRILRLPSSLHSGVSRKCMVIKNLEKFHPDDAVPRFLMEAEL